MNLMQQFDYALDMLTLFASIGQDTKSSSILQPCVEPFALLSLQLACREKQLFIMPGKEALLFCAKQIAR